MIDGRNTINVMILSSISLTKQDFDMYFSLIPRSEIQSRGEVLLCYKVIESMRMFCSSDANRTLD